MRYLKTYQTISGILLPVAVAIICYMAFGIADPDYRQIDKTAEAELALAMSEQDDKEENDLDGIASYYDGQKTDVLVENQAQVRLRTAKREQTVRKVTESGTALRRAISKASGANAANITVTAQTVTLTKEAAVAWIDKTIRLIDDMETLKEGHRVDLLEEAKRVSIQITSEKVHPLERHVIRLDNEVDRLGTRERAMRSELLKSKRQGIWIPVVVGIASAAVGAGAMAIADKVR